MGPAHARSLSWFMFPSQPLVSRLALAAGVGLLADAGSDLRVLRVTPSGEAAPTTAVTVTFDRPVAGSLDRTVDVMDRIHKIVQETPGVAHMVDIPGMSFVMDGNASNFGSVFVILKPFHERRAPEMYSEAIANALRMRLMSEIAQDAFARVQRFSTEWHSNTFAGSTVRRMR